MKIPTQAEISCIARLKTKWSSFLKYAANVTGMDEAVLGGIMMRETEGGESKWLDVPGPGGRGDNGHGHGLMQIDDRSYPQFCIADWRDPQKNVLQAAYILRDFRRQLERILLSAIKSNLIPKIVNGDDITTGDFLNHAAIASYNCGPGNVIKGLKAGEVLDARTANHNYSEAVLAYADVYRNTPPASSEAPA